MSEVTGKTLHYWQGGFEKPIKGIDFDRAFDMLSATNTSTTSPGKKTVAGRAKTTVNITADFLNALGAEINSGDLTAGSLYMVTAKDSVLSAYSVGEIFEAAGTETMSATDKVKPIGSKITGKTLAVTIGGSTFKGIQIDYNKQYDELSATNTSITAPNKKSVAGRHAITSTFTALMYRDTADLITNDSPSEQAIVLTFDSGVTISGTGLLKQMSISDETEGIVSVTYQVDWQGVPTETNIGYLTVGSEESCQIIWEKGSTTNKEITGTALLLSMGISANADGDVTLQYSGVLNGTITPAVYS